VYELILAKVDLQKRMFKSRLEKLKEKLQGSLKKEKELNIEEIRGDQQRQQDRIKI